MIYSMTGYACYKIKETWGSATWEAKSINQRYLEISTYLPTRFRSLEPTIRKRIRSRLNRGKVECNLSFELDTNIQENWVLNEKLIIQLVNAISWIKSLSKRGEINLVDILRWPGVLISKEQDLEFITVDILNAFDRLLDNLITARKIEGQSLKLLIEQRLKIISDEIAKIRTFIPNFLQWQRKRILEKLEYTGIQLENGRLEQELILIAQRIDISEELDRLETHIKRMYDILNGKKEVVGKHIDFIVQEFNRESNTIASKSINIDITNSAIKLKVLIEQIREQIQNIE